MFDNWTFGKKVGAGFALAGVVLLVIAVVGFRSTVQLLENDRWVDHTHEVRRELALLLAEIVDAETGQRGFVISADESFLQPYEAARTRIPQTVGRIGTLTADNPEQQLRLSQL